jgi:hypothetical protein
MPDVEDPKDPIQRWEKTVGKAWCVERTFKTHGVRVGQNISGEEIGCFEHYI